MTELPIRVATDDDWPAISLLMQTAFHDATWDEQADRAERVVFESRRSLVVTDDNAVVGHAGAFGRDLTVPGAAVPAAHVSLVGVLPTHRRRRLLTRLMHRQLAEVTEPVAVLWASEGRIYRRFGYGMATQRVSLSVDNRDVRLPEPGRPGRLRAGDPASVRPQLARLYDSVRLDRPGWSSRDDRWWTHVLADPPGQRRGATALRAVLHDGAEGPDGYALWRTKADWSPGGPTGEVFIQEIVAADPDAYLELWRFLLAIDLTRSVKRWLGGPDDPLAHLVDEPRQLHLTTGDGLFVRIVDLPAALTARRYAAPVDAVLEVADPLLPENTGRWHLIGDSEKAVCTRVDAPPDLACDITELGAAYLGGTSLAALQAAGRVRELRPGSLAAVSTAFGWHRSPAGLEVF